MEELSYSFEVVLMMVAAIGLGLFSNHLSKKKEKNK